MWGTRESNRDRNTQPPGAELRSWRVLIDGEASASVSSSALASAEMATSPPLECLALPPPPPCLPSRFSLRLLMLLRAPPPTPPPLPPPPPLPRPPPPPPPPPPLSLLMGMTVVITGDTATTSPSAASPVKRERSPTTSPGPRFWSSWSMYDPPAESAIAAAAATAAAAAAAAGDVCGSKYHDAKRSKKEGGLGGVKTMEELLIEAEAKVAADLQRLLGGSRFGSQAGFSKVRS